MSMRTIMAQMDLLMVASKALDASKELARGEGDMEILRALPAARGALAEPMRILMERAKVLSA